MQARIDARKQLAEKLLAERNIESSENWLTTSSEQAHCKYFKRAVQADLGLDLFADLGFSLVDGLFAEFVFALALTPGLPVVFDAVGGYQQELSAAVGDARALFTSDYTVEGKLKAPSD